MPHGRTQCSVVAVHRGRNQIFSLLFLLLMTTTTAQSLAADPAVDAARAFREANGVQILQEYSRFLALPNDVQDKKALEHNAAYLQEQLEQRGAEVELLRLPGATPVVYARLPARKGAKAQRTLGIYLHYDGQPVDEDEWLQPPWQPTLYTADPSNGGQPRPLPKDGEAIDPEWRLMARSAADDKAPFPAMMAAIDALHEAGIERSSDLVFFFEGEEEGGSDHLGQYLRTYAEQLEVDGWLICDGPVHQSRRPQLVFGVRGYTGFELTVYGANRYLHSGHYGNWAPNPGMTLARLLATMKDDQGRVLIDGFYDDVSPVGEAEREAIANLPDFDRTLQRELGLAATEGNASLAERLLLPSFNVRGMKSAEVGASARNVIPTTASASVDIRLVAGLDPERMLNRVEQHLRQQGYKVLTDEPDLQTRLEHPKLVRMQRHGGYAAARTPIDHPFSQRVIAAAKRAGGQDLILMPTLGGSLPLYHFVQILEQPLIIVPIANHDNNQHAPNENLRLADLWRGIELMAALLTME